MPKFIFVRHGETDYQEVISKGYVGQARNFAKLSKAGREQALDVAGKLVKYHADKIITSPYTRAMETTLIINQTLGLNVEVVNDLHEWIVDLNFKFTITPDQAYDEFVEGKGKHMPHHKGNWETHETLKMRVDKALSHYTGDETIIVVCHANVMRTQTYFDDRIEYCDIREIKK